jgi:hypothetical protein
MSISTEEWEEWSCIFASAIPPAPVQPITGTENIDFLINEIYNTFNMVCAATMKKKGNMPGFLSSGGMMNVEKQPKHSQMQQNKITHV